MFMTQMLAFLAWHGLGSSHCDIGQQVPKRSGLIIFKQYIVVTTECKKQIWRFVSCLSKQPGACILH